MRKLPSLACVCLLGIADVVAPQPAVAGGAPPTDVSFSIDIPANFIKPGACLFPVNWSGTGMGGTIALPGGNRFIFTSPTLQVLVTNLDVPSHAVLLKVPGAFHQSIESNGDVVTVVTGRNLLGDPEAGMVLAIGTFSFIFDSAGNLVQPLSGKGQLINVCEWID